MAGDNELQILITAKDEASKALEGIKGHFKDIAKASAVVGAAITGAMGLAVKSAIDAEAVNNRLETVLKNVSHATNEQIDALKNQASALQLVTRFDDEAIKSAQAFLGTFNLSSNSIQDLTPHLLDMAEGLRDVNGATIGLEGASNMLGKALATGTLLGLQRVGITIPGVTKAQQELYNKTFELADQQQRVAMLTQVMDGNFKGLAESAGKTGAGGIDILKHQLGEIQETIGNQLIPVLIPLLQHVSNIIGKVLEWTAAHPKLTETLVIVTAAVGALLTLLPILIGLVTALASPFGVIILVIGAVVVAIVALTTAVILNWDAIKNKTTATWNAITGKIRDAWEEVKILVKEGINWIIDKLNWFANQANSITSKVGGAIGFSLPAIPTIPKLAAGGVVNRPTLAMIGEAGPEAVVPLNRGNKGAGIGTTINITINGDVSGEEIVEKIGDRLTRILQLSSAAV